jgi:hypothetical protein
MVLRPPVGFGKSDQAIFRKGISPNPEDLGALTVSMLRGENRTSAQGAGQTIALVEIRDAAGGRAFSKLSADRAGQADSTTMLHRPICVTLQEKTISWSALAATYRREALELMRVGVSSVEAFVVYSDFYASLMTDLLRIPARKMHVVPMESTLRVSNPALSAAREFTAFGTLPALPLRKGCTSSVRLIAFLRHERQTCSHAAGGGGISGAGAPSYLAEIQQKMKAWGLESEFQ